MVLAQGMAWPIQDGSGELLIRVPGHWTMVLVIAAASGGSVVRQRRGSECIVQADFESRARSAEERPRA